MPFLIAYVVRKN